MYSIQWKPAGSHGYSQCLSLWYVGVVIQTHSTTFLNSYPATPTHCVSLSTVPPAISIVPTAIELNEGDTLTLACEAMAQSTTNITWLFQDALLLQENTETITVTNTQTNFYSFQSTLKRSSLIPTDSGEYKCRLSANGNIVITDVASINVVGKHLIIPRIMI